MLSAYKQKLGLLYFKLKRRLALLREEWGFRWRVRSAAELKIVIGSSGVFEKSWIPTNYQYLNLLNEEDWRRAFGKKRIDAILAEHVFEHLTEAEGLQALHTCHKYMKYGARLRVAVPDGYNPDGDYIEMVRPGGVGAGCEDHKVLYNVEILEQMFVAAGFAVQRLEYFDAKGQFHRSVWQPEDGMIHRSLAHDPRNRDGSIKFTSLILDGLKL